MRLPLVQMPRELMFIEDESCKEERDVLKGGKREVKEVGTKI